MNELYRTDDCDEIHLKNDLERKLCRDELDDKAAVDLFRHARGLPMLHHASVKDAMQSLNAARQHGYGASGITGKDSSALTSSPSRQSMVGTKIHELLSRIGIEQKQGCGCGSRQRQLDAMSIENIQSHREQIEAMLNAQAKQLTMKQKLAAFANAARQGIFINPLNPARSILDHAIRQAKRQTKGMKANIQD